MIAALQTTGRKLGAPFLWLHRRLLPQGDPYVSWMPYLWLPWLTFFFLNYSGKPAGALRWTLYALGGLAFLVLYFRIYHAAHRNAVRELYGLIAAMLLLGCAFMWPFANGMAFFIYAACFCGCLGSVKRGGSALLVTIALFLISSVMVGVHAMTLLYGIFLIVILGIAFIYFDEIGRKNRALKQSEEEIRKLAASAERERIARDLHDLLGHTLTLVTVKAELAATLAERDLVSAAREIREVERISREALAQVREAVGGYRSSGLIGELANARVALTAANVRLAEKVEPPKLSPAQDSVLAMVLREAVTNVIRHSGAHHCRIELENRDRHIRLLVEDDGRGGLVHEGHGLKGMRERLQATAGKLEIDSSHGGTCLTVLLPVNPSASESGPVPA